MNWLQGNSSNSATESSPCASANRITSSGVPVRFSLCPALREDFSECGEIANIELLLDQWGAFRGVAWITMSDQAGFDAVLEYDGDWYYGRTLTFSQAHSTWGEPEGEGEDAGGGGARERRLDFSDSHEAPEERSHALRLLETLLV